MHVDREMSLEGKFYRDYIKQALKERKMTYGQLAKQLGVSLVTVKRWMSSHDMRLETLIKICRLQGINPIHLLDGSMDSKSQRHYHLVHEEYFASQPVDFLIFIKALMGSSFEEIREVTNLSPGDLMRRLRAMEKKEILQLMKGNRIQSLIRGPFRWIAGGPLSRAYLARMRSSLFKHFQRVSDTIDAPGQFACTVFRPFEFYLDPENARQLSLELLQILHRYRAMSHAQGHKHKDAKPIAGLIAVDVFDLWADVLL